MVQPFTKAVKIYTKPSFLQIQCPETQNNWVVCWRGACDTFIENGIISYDSDYSSIFKYDDRINLLTNSIEISNKFDDLVLRCDDALSNNPNLIHQSFKVRVLKLTLQERLMSLTKSSFQENWILLLMLIIVLVFLCSLFFCCCCRYKKRSKSPIGSQNRSIYASGTNVDSDFNRDYYNQINQDNFLQHPSYEANSRMDQKIIHSQSFRVPQARSPQPPTYASYYNEVDLQRFNSEKSVERVNSGKTVERMRSIDFTTKYDENPRHDPSVPVQRIDVPVNVKSSDYVDLGTKVSRNDSIFSSGVSSSGSKQFYDEGNKINLNSPGSRIPIVEETGNRSSYAMALNFSKDGCENLESIKNIDIRNIKNRSNSKLNASLASLSRTNSMGKMIQKSHNRSQTKI